MVYRSTSFGLVALLERAEPVLGSEGMGGPCGLHMASPGSLRGEQRGASCEKWHVAFCGATLHSQEDKLEVIAPKLP